MEKKKECPLAPVEVNIYELAIMKRHRLPFFLLLLLLLTALRSQLGCAENLLSRVEKCWRVHIR